MTDKKLESIISELKQNNNKEDAFFWFYKKDGDEFNTIIKANKQELQLFAVELHQLNYNLSCICICQSAKNLKYRSP